MFQPLRGIGFVADPIPFSISFRRNRSLLVSVVANSYHVYDTAQLRLIRVGPLMPQPIRAIAIHGSMEYVAVEGTVVGLLCTREQWRETHTTLGDVQQLIPVSTNVLLSLATDRTLAVWAARSGQITSIVSLDSEVRYTVGAIASAQYKSKILLGTDRGTLQLWNYATGRKVWDSVEVICLGVPVTAITVCDYQADILALGFDDGTVIVFNFVTAEELMRFRHADRAAVRGVAFSTVLLQLLITGTNSGEVAVWDLAERTLRGVLTSNAQADYVGVNEKAHVGACVHVQFLQHEPVVVTSGEDNAIRMYLFDSSNKSGRLLRSRAGHFAECTAVSFVDDIRLVTLSTDRTVRMHHVFTDLFSVELSQGKLRRIAKKKAVDVSDLRMPPASAVASCLPRKNDWASIVTIHDGCSFARTWRMDNLVMTKHVLDTEQEGLHRSVEATAVCTSRCGNLCVVGSSDGTLAVYYLQTGELRHPLPSHPTRVTHVSVTACNMFVVSVSRDGTIATSSLFSGDGVRTFQGGVGLGVACLHAEGCLLCVAGDDLKIHVYDVGPDASYTDSVRVLASHTAAITSVALDPASARYLVSAALDTTMCVWDLVTGALVARYRFDDSATTVTFSPNGHFLATTHADCRGTYVWTNMLRYGVRSDIVTSDAKVAVHLVYPDAVPDTDLVAAEDIGKRSREASPEPLLEEAQEGTLTLSTIPRAKVMSIPNVDVIQQMSKPILPPKKFNAPFFLPTTKELHPTFVVPRLPLGAAHAPSRDKAAAEPTSLAVLLRDAKYEEALEHLKALSAAGAVLELERILSFNEETARNVSDVSELDEDKANLQTALRFFANCVSRRNDIDVVEALLQAFLRAHGSMILLWKEELRTELHALYNAQRAAAAHARTLHDASMALVRHLRPSTV